MTENGDEIVRITTPLPFRPGTVNAYLVPLDAGGWMLVDGGMDSDAAWDALEAELTRHTPWDGLRLHVITHMHVDHIGLARRVRDASSVPLAMGTLDAERAGHAAADPAEEDEYREALLARSGVPEAVVAALRAPMRGMRSGAAFVEPAIRLRMPAASLDGAPEWRAVWSPGHTAGHVSLFRERDRELIAGDAVLPTITPTIGVNRQRPDPVGDYAATLDRLAELRPRRILPGHGEPLEGAGRLAGLRDELHAETGRVLALLAGGPTTPWQIAEARYRERDLPLPLRLQALRETLAHLEHLTRSGRARRVEEEGGAVRFGAV